MSKDVTFKEIKKAIESAALIFKWNPTNEHIKNIIRDLISTEETLNRKTVRSIIQKHYKKPLHIWVLKGLNVLEADEALNKLIRTYDENYLITIIDRTSEEVSKVVSKTSSGNDKG